MEEIRRRYLSIVGLSYFYLFFSLTRIVLIVFFQFNRAGADDKPLRMVKTVLHELVKLRGAAIKGHLSMVPIDTKPQPIILAYIELNLEVGVNYFGTTFICPNIHTCIFVLTLEF